MLAVCWKKVENHQEGPMRTAAIGMVGVLILAGGLSAQRAPSLTVRNGETFTGEITDSLCAEGHYVHILKNAKTCILACVRSEAAQFVLYNPATRHIYKLDDQQKPEAFAGQEVTILGSYDREKDEIHVAHIRPKVTATGSPAARNSDRTPLL
jgi:hypothetical protein